MNSRLIFLSFPVIALLVAGHANSFAELPSSNPSQKIALKPFQQGDPAKPNLSVAGAWKGTFSSTRRSEKEESTYLVEVPDDLSTLRVSAVPPISGNTDTYLNPTTTTFVAADWDGETLKAEARESKKDGDAQISVVKTFTLRLGMDARHAVFSYKVTVKTTTKKTINTNVLKGEGTLKLAR